MLGEIVSLPFKVSASLKNIWRAGEDSCAGEFCRIKSKYETTRPFRQVATVFDIRPSPVVYQNIRQTLTNKNKKKQ